MKIVNLTSLFLILTNLFSCHQSKVSGSSDNSIFADAVVKKDGEKLTAQFIFYRQISEILNSKENKDFGRSPVIVDFPKLNGVEMKEVKTSDIQKVYLAEIENVEKDYTSKFMRKDGEYRAIIRINPNDLKLITAEFRRTEK